MKRTLQIALGALGLVAVTALSPSAQAAEGLTANAAVTTNYIFRGISQSGGNPAVQAGMDYDLGAAGLSGFAVGTWVSSIDFGDDSPMEWDIYASYTGTITEMASWSIGALEYAYPNTPGGVNYSWQEYWAGLTYNFGPFAVAGKVYYSPDYVNLSTSQIYYNGSISIPVASWLTFNAAVGHTDLDNDVPPLIQSYTDWTISAAATFEAFTLTVGYTDTSLDGIYEVTSGPFQTTEQLFVMLGFRLM